MNILIAEDDATARLVLRATLTKLGHTVTAVENGRAAWDAWQTDGHPLVISDWMMPDLDGIALTRRIRAEARFNYTYVVLLTARSGKVNYLDGMDAGADDVITKPFDEAQLAARLRVADRILALHRSLQERALTDGLTGLWNRAAILDRLAQELDRAARDGKCTGVMMADLDHFKRINDTHGHLTGDAVLREAGRRMASALRSYDRIGRYGGEEFLIVSPTCSSAELRVIAERIRNCVRATPIATPAGPVTVTVSIGVAGTGRANETAEALIGAADEALYRSKEAGRDRVELAGDTGGVS